MRLCLRYIAPLGLYMVVHKATYKKHILLDVLSRTQFISSMAENVH